MNTSWNDSAPGARQSAEFCHPNQCPCHRSGGPSHSRALQLPAAPAVPERARRPMALKSTIYKATLQIADMDRSLYADHALTLARHPSETDERLMMRLLAFALRVPADDRLGLLTSAAGLSDVDEPDLWQKDLTGELRQWVEVGQPDERRLTKACARAERVGIYAYSSAVPVWWSGMSGKVDRLANLEVWQVPAEQSQSLAELAERSMQLQVTVQEGLVWFGNGERSVELAPRRLHPAP